MQIILNIDDQTGQITVSANGQDTPVESLDEAISAVQAIAQETLGAPGAEINGGDVAGPEQESPTTDQLAAAEEGAMMRSYKPRKV